MSDLKKLEMVDYHGWKVSKEEYDDLTQNYVYVEHSDLNSELVSHIKELAFAYIQSTIKAIDSFILTIDYAPEAAHDDLKIFAIEFFKSDLVHAAMDDDLVSLEQSLEVICGIVDKEKQKIVYHMIHQCMTQITKLLQLLQH